MSESDRESDGAPCEVEYNEEQEGEEDADLEELPEGQRDIVDYYLEEPPVGDEYGDGVASEDEDDEEEFVPLNQLGALQTSSQVTHKSAPRDLEATVEADKAAKARRGKARLAIKRRRTLDLEDKAATGGKALRSAARLLRAAVADDEPAAQTSCPYCRALHAKESCPFPDFVREQEDNGESAGEGRKRRRRRQGGATGADQKMNDWAAALSQPKFDVLLGVHRMASARIGARRKKKKKAHRALGAAALREVGDVLERYVREQLRRGLPAATAASGGAAASVETAGDDQER